MADIFISYAREDHACASRMAAALADRGWTVFWDRAIPTGKSFDEVIERELDAARCVVVLWSRHSISSDWVKSEAGEAARRGILNPAWIEDVRLPLEFRRLQTARLIDWTSSAPDPEFDRFVGDIAQTLGVAPAAAGASRPAPSALAVEDSAPQPAIKTARAEVARDDARGGTVFGELLNWGRARPAYLVALAAPPLGVAVGQVFRLRVVDADLLGLIGLATVVVCAGALALRSRLGAGAIGGIVGLAAVLKVWLIPVESFTEPIIFWGPGALLLVSSIGLLAASKPTRLVADLRRLRPSLLAVAVALVSAATAYSYFARPTVYDVYRSFRPRYAELRSELKMLAGTLDAVSGPNRAAGGLDAALVLDDRGRTMDEDPSTTGHLILYQQLTEPEGMFGGIAEGFENDLLLHLRRTGPGLWLSDQVLAGFATDEYARSLQQTLDAPYLVVVKPLSMDQTRRVEISELPTSGPYRVFLYHLKQNMLVLTLDVVAIVNTTRDLKDAVYAALDTAVGAKILR